MTVNAIHRYRNNGELIVAAMTLGYLRDDWSVLDPTWGRGTFWTIWRPKHLVGSDLATGVDFRHLPHDDATFDAVVFDPPYKLNGRPTDEVDGRYGVGGSYTSAGERHKLMRDGLAECARVVRPRGYVLAKCQDQVNAGRVRWQTMMLWEHGIAHDLLLVDQLHYVGGRPQPEGRRQQHARRNYSTLMVFRKAGPKRVRMKPKKEDGDGRSSGE